MRPEMLLPPRNRHRDLILGIVLITLVTCVVAGAATLFCAWLSRLAATPAMHRAIEDSGMEAIDWMERRIEQRLSTDVPVLLATPDSTSTLSVAPVYLCATGTVSSACRPPGP